jgi:hypothetical protein
MSKEQEIDYLTVDEPINGQKFCCISFVEPSVDRLAHKESYIFHNFMEQYGHILYIQFCKHHGLKPDSKLNIEMKEVYERYTDFKAIKYAELCKKYDEEIDNETHIRAMKVKGSYPSAAIVGQVGYWVPFNPININDVEPEYLEGEMQQLVKTHLEQEDKKKEVFDKRTETMLQQVKVEGKDAVQILEESDESNTINAKKRKRKELPPVLKAKLQQQLLDQKIASDCIQIEKVEEHVKQIEDNHIEVELSEVNDAK